MPSDLTFADIIFKSIGKRVRLQVMVAENPPYSYDGTLIEVNKNYMLLEDNDIKAEFYINLKVSSISSIEVFQ